MYFYIAIRTDYSGFKPALIYFGTKPFDIYAYAKDTKIVIINLSEHAEYHLANGEIITIFGQEFDINLELVVDIEQNAFKIFSDPEGIEYTEYYLDKEYSDTEKKETEWLSEEDRQVGIDEINSWKEEDPDR